MNAKQNKTCFKRNQNRYFPMKWSSVRNRRKCCKLSSVYSLEHSGRVCTCESWAGKDSGIRQECVEMKNIIVEFNTLNGSSELLILCCRKLIQLSRRRTWEIVLYLKTKVKDLNKTRKWCDGRKTGDRGQSKGTSCTCQEGRANGKEAVNTQKLSWAKEKWTFRSKRLRKAKQNSLKEPNIWISHGDTFLFQA